MTVKIKWLTIKTPKSLDDIYLLLTQYPYSESESLGFVGVGNNDGRIEATFTECKKTYSEIEDPFGNITEQELVSYSYFDFCIESLADGLVLLSVYAPPKSLKPLTRKLGEIFDFNAVVSGLKLDIDLFLRVFKDQHNATSIQIEKLKMSGLVLNNSSKANIEITSSSDASKEISNFTEGKHYTLDRVRALALHHGSAIKFELSKAGSLAIRDQYIQMFTSILKDYMAARINSHV
ncbi:MULTISPECIES: hypothetical protein [Vibrio oreintalis group]|uniref:Uncharacterized protein n=1 Tax=Vibrio tubiashii ATCC 19109 TaxID=1051646 RepID=F9TC40_9VIBR|nr:MULTISPECIES: hypothetical protein [Vibrio oreintalis group]AIW15089.1 hypothetical protein IX91_13075 [Vibrio tubiashii ATCC 19109]EGU48177.1 hypothetical protein VITU9109_11905 [Vibrio tubiashii ATCC 19109]EIF05373.1 hypothetical protein VT1337_03795 [Vibrio tubiashii NCIMB 1337 = ATCC 19106]MDC5813044.1 hypothetical protein [Vibrio europaeus]QPG36061.1 hypothetical protein IXK98_21820 [Vibrio europaeus]